MRYEHQLHGDKWMILDRKTGEEKLLEAGKWPW